MDFQINMARMSQALDDYQAADPPIHFHRFDDIHVPSDRRAPLFLKVGTGSLYKLLRAMGLVDSGANGGIFNVRDMRLMYFHPDDRRVNISGVGNHKITDRRLATFCVVIETDLGPVLGIFHNYAFIGE